MKTALILTLLGEDNPGLVASLAECVAHTGGNWLESSMSHLGGQFAGILRVEVAMERVPELLVRLQELRKRGLHITTSVEPNHEMQPTRALHSLEVVGQDRPGIVAHLTRALSNHGVNIEELSTGLKGAPWSGEPLFEAKARLLIPVDADTEAIRSEMEKIAADMVADLKFVALQ